MTQAADITGGYLESYGADRYFLSQAKKDGTQIRALEEPRVLYQALAKLPDGLLQHVIEQFDTKAEQAFRNKLTAAYCSADVAAADKLMNTWLNLSGVPSSLRADYDEMVRRLYTDRVGSMAQQAQQALSKGETVFLAVDTPFACGSNGLVRRLQAMGYTVRLRQSEVPPGGLIPHSPRVVGQRGRSGCRTQRFSAAPSQPVSPTGRGTAPAGRLALHFAFSPGLPRPAALRNSRFPRQVYASCPRLSSAAARYRGVSSECCPPAEGLFPGRPMEVVRDCQMQYPAPAAGRRRAIAACCRTGRRLHVRPRPTARQNAAGPHCPRDFINRLY